MSGAQPIVQHHLANVRRQFKQTHRVRHMTAAFAYDLGDLLLRVVMLGKQPLIGFRFLDRAQIFALKIFNERKFQNGAVINILNDHRHVMQACQLRGTPSPFTGNDFKTVIDGIGRPNDQWLEDSLAAD